LGRPFNLSILDKRLFAFRSALSLISQALRAIDPAAAAKLSAATDAQFCAHMEVLSLKDWDAWTVALFHSCNDDGAINAKYRALVDHYLAKLRG
jgi:hypothetical protein